MKEPKSIKQPQRFEVWSCGLPKQPIFHTIRGVRREIEPSESFGEHPVLIWAVEDENRWVSAIPLTSAQNSDGSEKWQVWRSHWVRINDDGYVSMADVSGLRQIDRWRLKSKIGRLGDYDVRQVATKLQSWLKFI